MKVKHTRPVNTHTTSHQVAMGEEDEWRGERNVHERPRKEGSYNIAISKAVPGARDELVWIRLDTGRVKVLQVWHSVSKNSSGLLLKK